MGPTITEEPSGKRDGVIYILDKELEDLFRDIFAINEDISHEILEPLHCERMIKWKFFRQMDLNSTRDLSKRTGEWTVSVPI